jgi:tRNA(Phe) wybutosine-synthesizing methylase Tyw3
MCACGCVHPQEGRRAGKKGGEWVYASHDPADEEEVLTALHSRCGSGTWPVVIAELAVVKGWCFCVTTGRVAQHLLMRGLHVDSGMLF